MSSTQVNRDNAGGITENVINNLSAASGAIDIDNPKQIFFKQKPLPNDLQYEIQASGSKAGASIFIMDLKNSRITHATNNFYLTGMQFSYQEKAQIMETFGASSVSFFGQKTVIYQFSGVTIDWLSQTGDKYRTMQNSSLLKLYSEYLRGTQLLKNKSIAILKVFNHTVWGYPLNFVTSHQAAGDGSQNFQMNWVVTKHNLNLPNFIEEIDLAKSFSPIENKVSGLSKIQELINEINKLQQVETGQPNTFYNYFTTSKTQWKANFDDPKNTQLKSNTINIINNIANKAKQLAEVSQVINMVAVIQLTEFVEKNSNFTEADFDLNKFEEYVILAKTAKSECMSKLTLIYQF